MPSQPTECRFVGTDVRGDARQYGYLLEEQTCARSIIDSVDGGGPLRHQVGWRAILCCGRVNATATMSSVTFEKSSKNCATAKKSSDVYRQTTSSASPSIRASDDGGATAIATTTFLGFRARTDRIADRTDDPVATPSSTMMTVRPSGLTAACAPVYCSRLMRRMPNWVRISSRR
jgi:hypothetical protein